MKVHYTDLQPMPLPVPVEKARSAIETRFPHIARELSVLWQTDQIGGYLDNLLIDSRGDRQGFQADVLDELMFLSGMRWHLLHQESLPEDFQRLDHFSFAASNEADIRRYATNGAWVLV